MRFALPAREFGVLFAVLLTVAAGNTAMQTVLPGIARAIHIPDMLVAIIFSFSALLWTFSAPYWARQSDIRGRRRLTEVGVIGFGVSMLGCGIVVYAGLKGLLVPVATFALFAGLRSLFGIFGSASNPAAQAYVAARTSEANRTNALSTLSSAFGLGTIIGPAVAPLFIIGAVGLAGPFFAFAIVAVIVLLAVRRYLPDDDPRHFPGAIGAGAGADSDPGVPHGAPASEPSVAGGATGASARAAALGRAPRLSWRDPRILPFMIFGFFSGSIQAATGQAMGFLVIDRFDGPPEAAQGEIAIVFMAGAGATLLAQWGLIPTFKMTPPLLMRWGTGIAALGTAGIAISQNFHSLVVAFALASLGYGFARPGFTAGASLAVGRAEQGGVAGAVTSINGSCFVLAPAIGIGLYQLGPTLPYLLGSIALTILLVFAAGNRALRTVTIHEDQ
ncbi:MFS transporter [Polymorphobacter fuscus]|uniref:MFS transporter n=1 Tax=Sandarakinorhabdus fusca TaxID=1439888 RepID=A0A7C9KJC0_9SPHN|nr:MFS transporter [Polymorphobacter fuscus]KAB7645522.1 MFS transporter [Polymorphobacter fuscus]MQT17959.1 MFS transporter [Polymorphobacter fuscus]NJC08589.1 MFS family permease [Polymorphobacter fuscus]